MSPVGWHLGSRESESWPTHCARCGADLSKTSSSMSRFNTDTCCAACIDKERKHPRYKEAEAAEEAACRRGNYNFRGIGKPGDL